MTHSTNAPDECQPMDAPRGDLLDTLAEVLEDFDNLREECGLPSHNGHWLFTRADRKRGHDTEPTATVDQNGDLLVRMEG